MTKLKVTMTVVSEYDADPEDYDDASTAEEMAEMDRKNFVEEPNLVLDEAEPEQITIKVEVATP